MLARKKSKIIETVIFKAFIEFEISHEQYSTIFKKEEKYRRQKEHTRKMKRQKSDAEKDKLIEKGKRIGIKVYQVK